jgi:hypothetical protein
MEPEQGGQQAEAEIGELFSGKDLGMAFSLAFILA